MSLKVVLAPNALKECMSAKEAIVALKAGVLLAKPDATISEVPLADGGDGMLSAFQNIMSGECVSLQAEDPLGRMVESKYLILEGGTAVVEMALVSGLALLEKEEQNPMVTSTYGMGQVLNHAMERGVRKFIIGIGGSSTNDVGAGMAQALGFEWQGLNGERACGGNLKNISGLESSKANPALAECSFKVACDVKNPLLGKDGCSTTFSPQKGANLQMVAELEQNVEHFNTFMTEYTGMDDSKEPGAGAAGGIGYLFRTLLGGELVSGSELLLEQTGFVEKLKGADLVITAEGCLDAQTIEGKLPQVIAMKSEKAGVPCVALVGKCQAGWQSLREAGLCAFAIAQGPTTLEDSIKNADLYLRETCTEVVRLFLAGKK